MKTLFALIIALSFPVLFSDAQDAQTLIHNAVKSLGATDLKTLEYSGSGYSFSFGQNPNPNMPWPKFNAKSFTKGINYESGASTQKLVRTQAENPPRGGGMQPLIGEQTQNQVVDSNSPWTARAQIWITPHGLLKAALSNNATVKSTKVGGKKLDMVSFTAENKYKVNGFLNERGEVEKVETWVDNAVLGDVAVEVSYSEYKDFNGLKFPTRIVQKDGGYPVYDLTITEVKPNVEVTIQPNPPATPPVVATEKIADGIYNIAGGGATASVAVEFADFVTVLEAPLSEARSLAVIEEVKKIIPNKPIKYLVNTHHHFDHSSGLRTYVAEGSIIVTHDVNKAFYQKTFATPHTLNPDKLELSKKKAVIESFKDKKKITDGVRTIELYHIAGNLHNDGIIMIYFPKEKILSVCDMFPRIPADAPVPETISPFATNLLENIDRLKLDFDVILPFHGTVTNKAELMRVVRRNN
jgi:glyoxylase-like metal-dependent hydrolase (beta-lactamase superfamily II)